MNRTQVDFLAFAFSFSHEQYKRNTYQEGNPQIEKNIHVR